jgi:cleavage and polyadenylation specificity factor subunit 1
MPTALLLAGKRAGGAPSVSTLGPAPKPDGSMLTILDSNSGRRFLVDTGAQVSVIPAQAADRVAPQASTEHRYLQAANGSRIKVYGDSYNTLSFAGRKYRAYLLRADVQRPLLGADFLRRHKLLVDVSNQRLVDSAMLPIPCSVKSKATSSRLEPVIIDENPYSELLRGFPTLTQPTFTVSQPRHGIVHHIPTK